MARRLLNVVIVGGLLVASVGVVNVEAARADPPSITALNAASVYAVNVPGAVLAEATPGSISGAVLASGQAYDWAYAAPAYAAVSGTFTPTPAPPDVALTPAERAAFNEIAANYRGAPATRLTSLVKGAGAAGAVVMSYDLGARVGNGLVELWGVDADGLVCAAAEGVGQVALSLLTGADCTGYNQMRADFLANIDVTPSLQGGTSCTPNGDCMTLVAEQLVQFSAPFGSSNPSQWNSSRFWCLQVSNASAPNSINYLRTSGNISLTTASAWPTTHAAFKDLTCSGNRYIAIASTSTNGTYPSFVDRPAAWVYNPAEPYSAMSDCLRAIGPCAGGTRAVPIEVVEDIERTLVCTIVGSNNITYTATSSTFTEGSGSLPPIVCPQLPAGVTVASLTVTEQGGATSFDLLEQDATDAYIDWWETYPECVNGSCLLDLRQSGISCFTTGVDCNGWFTDPARDSTYTCRYGTHTIALAGCYVYATTFSPTHQEDGTAYADPITGDSVQTPTSPTELDRLTRKLLERGWLTHGPTNDGFVYGDAAENPDPYVAARAVAVTCIALGVQDECDDLPIFAPGDNIKEAAVHDLEAIMGHPTWALLTRADPPQVVQGWYVGVGPCIPPYSPKQCDEYPFKSTGQAGYLSGTQASLKLIDAADNEHEGTYLGLFYGACLIGNNDPYLVVPIPSPGGSESRNGPPTAAWCG